MKLSWVWVAICISTVFVLAQLLFGVKITVDDSGLPLLMVLLMNELGFILCAIVGWMSVNVLKKSGLQLSLAIGVLVLTGFAVGFLWNLIRLFPSAGV